MNTRKAISLAGVCLVCVVVAFAVVNFSGCKEAAGLTGLNITPSYVQLTSVSNTVEFTVSGGTSNDLSLPIAWSVSNPELGFIKATSGYRALYIRHAAPGDNIVYARDQYDNEGYARIRQIQGGQSLSLSKVQADSRTWTITVVSSAGGPFEWWVHDPTIGVISSAGNEASVVYTVKDDTQSNDVYVRDASGNIGSVSIP